MKNSLSKWWILTIAVLINFMIGIDATAVNLILAPLSSQLHVPISQLQWIMNAYLLIYSACIVAGGRLGDIFNQKYVIITGIAGFVSGSLLAGFSHTFALLLSGRVIQGISASLMSPNAMAIIYRVFPKEQKGIATGITTSVIGATLAIGPFIGGLLTHLYSWRLIFFINLPIGLIVILLASLFIHFPKNKQAILLKQIDLPGAATLGLILFGLVATLDLTDSLPTHLLGFLSLIISSIVLLFIFIYIEKHTANPIINIDLLKNKAISIGCLIRFLFGTPCMVFVFVFALYLQHSLGYSTLATGIMFLPLTIMIIAAAPFGGKLVDKAGSTLPTIIGIAFCIAASIGLSLHQVNTKLSLLLILFGLIGIGLGLVRPAIVTTIMKATPESKLGVISSLANMMNNLGCSVGIVTASVIIGFYERYYKTAALNHSIPVIMYFCIGTFVLIIPLTLFGLKKSEIDKSETR